MPKLDTWLIICVKSFLLLPVSHSTSATDGRTDDNHDNSSTVTQVWSAKKHNYSINLKFSKWHK